MTFHYQGALANSMQCPFLVIPAHIGSDFCFRVLRGFSSAPYTARAGRATRDRPPGRWDGRRSGAEVTTKVTAKWSTLRLRQELLVPNLRSWRTW